jgi:hypothetical protein
LAAQALVVALYGSSQLALAFCGGLLVKLTGTQLGRRMATSNGSFSFTRTVVMNKLPFNKK